MHTVKITVLKKNFDAELADVYGADGFKPCDAFSVGQIFQAGYDKPEGFGCEEAWNCIRNYVLVLAHTGKQAVFYSGDWMKEPGCVVCCCNDGLRPVLFKIEAVD